MKNFFIQYLLLFSLLITACSGNTHKPGTKGISGLSDTGNAVITFSEYEHDFGKVKEGEKVACIFTFTNTGTGALVINSATTSCGCTVSKYNTKPVAPGGTGSLEVVFDTSDRNGIQTKTISVHSNATVPMVLLKISTEVIYSNNN